MTKLTTVKKVSKALLKSKAAYTLVAVVLTALGVAGGEGVAMKLQAVMSVLLGGLA
jgi:hypothetical protein